VVHAWQVVPVTGTGQISNVSAFVLPVGMPVADDAQQLPMFDGEEQTRIVRELLEVARIQAHTIEQLTGHQDGTIGSLRRPRSGDSRPKKHARKPSSAMPIELESSRLHQPQDKRLRTWRGCVLAYQDFERAVKAEGLAVTPESLWRVGGGPSAKTTRRILDKRYHVPRECWPPSTWDPDHPPVALNGQI
jgi:hypothetical protein